MQEPTSPDYYMFPNGTQSLDIAQYLTGLGSQIVQYVSRSCRMDGKIKGNPIKDLRKSTDLTIYEIARLTNNTTIAQNVVTKINNILDDAFGVTHETP